MWKTGKNYLLFDLRRENDSWHEIMKRVKTIEAEKAVWPEL